MGAQLCCQSGKREIYYTTNLEVKNVSLKIDGPIFQSNFIQGGEIQTFKSRLEAEGFSRFNSKSDESCNPDSPKSSNQPKHKRNKAQLTVNEKQSIVFRELDLKILESRLKPKKKKSSVRIIDWENFIKQEEMKLDTMEQWKIAYDSESPAVSKEIDADSNSGSSYGVRSVTEGEHHHKLSQVRDFFPIIEEEQNLQEIADQSEEGQCTVQTPTLPNMTKTTSAHEWMQRSMSMCAASLVNAKDRHANLYSWAQPGQSPNDFLRTHIEVNSQDSNISFRPNLLSGQGNSDRPSAVTFGQGSKNDNSLIDSPSLDVSKIKLRQSSFSNKQSNSIRSQFQKQRSTSNQANDINLDQNNDSPHEQTWKASTSVKLPKHKAVNSDDQFLMRVGVLENSFGQQESEESEYYDEEEGSGSESLSEDQRLPSFYEPEQIFKEFIKRNA